jgi:hypothetical protein
MNDPLENVLDLVRNDSLLENAEILDVVYDYHGTAVGCRIVAPCGADIRLCPFTLEITVDGETRVSTLFCKNPGTLIWEYLQTISV